MRGLFRVGLLVLLAVTCAAEEDARQRINKVVLRNSNGMEAHILKTGACIQQLLVPNAAGELVDVMLGFEDEEAYQNGTSVSGCIVGRYGGKITGGNFTVNGKSYQLEKDRKGNTLHGGGIGYSRVQWEVEAVSFQEYSGNNESWAVLSYDSPDGEQGFPGNLQLEVQYTLGDDNSFAIDIRAITDKATPVNVFSHPYFNLAGLEADNATILDHKLTIDGEYYVGTDSATGAATGKVVPVRGSPLDFIKPHAIGERIRAFDSTSKGYQHQYVLFGNGQDVKKAVTGFNAAELPQLAATLAHPASGLGLEISTTTPTLVLYTGNAFKGKFESKGGVRPQQYAAVALETTMFPEAGNLPDFPSPVLRPGKEFHTQTVWRFFISEE